MKLVTVKEYAVLEKISDQGVRKRLDSGVLSSVQHLGNTYIVIEDNSGQIIKDLKAKIRLLNANVRALRVQAVAVADREEEVQYLRDRMQLLETKLDASTEKKEELYEKVINVLRIESK